MDDKIKNTDYISFEWDKNTNFIIEIKYPMATSYPPLQKNICWNVCAAMIVKALPCLSLLQY